MPRYNVKINGKEYDVELGSSADTGKVRVNDSEVSVLSHRLTNSRTLLSVDNKTYEIDIHPNGNGSRAIFMRGLELEATVEDYQLAQLRKVAGFSGAAEKESLLKASMPGLVVRLEVAVGDSVKKGTPLLVIEAMKMENVIKASGDNVIKNILVEAGAVIEKGEKLLEFE